MCLDHDEWRVDDMEEDDDVEVEGESVLGEDGIRMQGMELVWRMVRYGEGR